MKASHGGMNCLLETVASVWMLSLRQVYGSVPVEEDVCVQEGLDSCRASLEQREVELSAAVVRIGREALRRRDSGDLAGARGKMMERRRGLKRLEKLRSSLALVDAQLDALRTTELDRELMQTLVASSAALKKAGVGKGVKEAEQIMTELDEQLRDSSELTLVLAGPLQDDGDLDEEFEELLRDPELTPLPEKPVTRPVLVNYQEEPAPVKYQEEPALTS